MREQFEITTNAQWKALGHPLRVGILGLLVEKPLTNEQLARALNVESGKLHFHTKKLLQAEMIELAETRANGPIIEKAYRAVARHYVAPEPVSDGTKPRFDDALTMALERYRTTWRETQGLPDGIEMAYNAVMTMPRARAGEFARRFLALAKEFVAAGSGEPDAEPAALTILMHSLPPARPVGDNYKDETSRKTGAEIGKDEIKKKEGNDDAI